MKTLCAIVVFRPRLHGGSWPVDKNNAPFHYLIHHQPRNAARQFGNMSKAEFAITRGFLRAQRVNSLSETPERVGHRAVTPDRRHAVTVSDHKQDLREKLRVWDLNSGRLVANCSLDSPLTCCAAGLGTRFFVGDETGRLLGFTLEF